LLVVLLVLAISVGAVPILLKEAIRTLFGSAGAGRRQNIIFNISWPQALAAVAVSIRWPQDHPVILPVERD